MVAPERAAVAVGRHPSHDSRRKSAVPERGGGVVDVQVVGDGAAVEW